MKLRDSKKLNIIVQGMPSAGDDLAAFLSLVDKELKLKPLVTSVKRLVSKSKAPTTPRPTGPAAPAPLLVTLRDTSDRRLLLSNAKVFRSSADVYVKDSIFINPDLTLMERQEGFSLRSELRRRKAAGEADIIIRNETIVKRPAVITPP